MPTLKPLLNKLLRKNKISLADLNKNPRKQSPKEKAIKKEIIDDLMRIAIIESRTQSKKGNPLVGKSLSMIRETGIKFSNQQGRNLFNTRTEKHYKSSYSTKLKSEYKPNPDKLPFLETREVKGGFLYTARVYLRSYKSKQNDKKIPHKADRIGTSDKYFKTAKYAFWSDEPISKKIVKQLIRDLLKGKQTNLVNDYVVDTSNVNDINFSIFRPVAFVYTGALRT